MSIPQQVYSGSAASPPAAAGHGTISDISRYLVIDASIVSLLVLAVAAVHGIDRQQKLEMTVASSPQPPQKLAGAEELAAASVAVAAEDAVDASSEPSGVEQTDQGENDGPDAAPTTDHPSPRRSAGIIADFVPFTGELIRSREPVPTDLMEPAKPPPSDHVADPPQPVLLDTPPPKKVEFFETETRAHSVGFVVDCSSSMDGARFEAVRAELAKSISQLKSDQKFFVVFFNDGFFPMTGNSPRPQLVSADHKNKQQILAFLRNASSSGGTNPEPALQFMAGLRPDVIYLLTDGGFSPLQPGTYHQLTAARIAVHTIGFETGYAVPILEEIAKRTLGTYRSAGMGNVGPSLFLQDPPVIRAALSHIDPAVRKEAISVAITRQLPFVKDLIEMLGDADQTVRQTVREELRNVAEGTDFGPRDDGDLPAAITRWNRWWNLRKATKDVLLSGLQGGDPDELWIAASLIRTNRVSVPDECIAAMKTAPSPVWQELRAAIRHNCPGQDFGPPDAATTEQVADAADQWAAWRAEERERAERERLAKRIKLAKEKMRLARDLIEDNPEAVIRRCRELIRNFADTPSAEEAKVLLAELGGTLEDE